MPDSEIEQILKELENENIKSVSTDTKMFRAGLLKKVVGIEKTIATSGCLFNAEKTKEHEEILKDLQKNQSEFRTEFQLASLKWRTGNIAIVRAIKGLGIGRKENSDRIGVVEKQMAKLGTIAWCVSIFWSLVLVGVGALVFLHDRIPHNNPAVQMPHKEIAIKEETEDYAFLITKEKK